MRTSKQLNGNVFANFTINNDSLNTQPIVASLSRTLQDPIVDNPSEYDMVITRFAIPGKAVPLFNFNVQPFPNTDVNKGIYSIGLEYNGNSSPPQYLEWIPQTLTAPKIPVFNVRTPTPARDDPYYYNYSYQNIANMINNALVSLIASSPWLPAGVDCYMTYDAVGGLFTLWGKNMANSSNPFDPLNVRIWFSTPLQTMFTGFKNIHKAYNSISGQDEMILIEDDKDNKVGDYYKITMEYNSDSNMQSLARILLLSSGFGGVGEQAEVYDTLTESNPYSSLVTDFVPEASAENGSYRSKFTFFTGSEFMRRPLTSSTPLYNVDFKFVWEDRSSRVHDLYLFPGDVLSIQILFVKR